MDYLRYLTIIGIIAICAVVFATEQAKHTSYGEEWGAVPSEIHAAFNQIREGKPTLAAAKTLSTLVTCAFLHADITHIVYNMVFLWTFGVLCSQLLGQWRTLAFYLVCAIGAALAHTLMHLDEPVPMVGASGAICGLQGLYVGLALRWQLPFAEVWPLAYALPPMQLVVFAMIGFVGDVILFSGGDHIAHGAHMGGLMTGIFIAAVITTIYPTLKEYWQARR